MGIPTYTRSNRTTPFLARPRAFVGDGANPAEDARGCAPSEAARQLLTAFLLVALAILPFGSMKHGPIPKALRSS